MGALATIVLTVAIAVPNGAGAVGQRVVDVRGVLLVSLVPWLLYRMDGIGGGDVKLLAVVGAALGPYMGIEAELYAFASVVLWAPAAPTPGGQADAVAADHRSAPVSAADAEARRSKPTAVSELTAFRFGPSIFTGTLAVLVLRLVTAA